MNPINKRIYNTEVSSFRKSLFIHKQLVVLFLWTESVKFSYSCWLHDTDFSTAHMFLVGSSQDFGHSKTSAQGFLSAAGHRLSFLPEHNWAIHFILTVVCTVDLGTCNCFQMAPSDFPDLSKSIWAMLSSLDFPIVVFVAESYMCF